MTSVILRNEQIDVLDAAAKQAFSLRVAEYLRTRHGQAIVRLPGVEVTVREMPETTLATLVESGIVRAHSYGLTWESSLNAFVTLMVVVAPNFDDEPAIRAALAPDHRPPDFRMKELDQRITQRDWAAAAKAYDPRSWRSRSFGS